MPTFPTTGLVSYWTLDESSGTRVDSHGTNHLTPINGPTSAAGKINTASRLAVASTQYLSHASNSDLQLGDRDWTIQVWANRTGGGNQTYLAKDATTREYHLDVATAQIRLYWVNGGVPIVTATAPGTGIWEHILAWYDATANTLNLQINNGSVNTVSDGGNLPPTGNDEFRIGHSGSGGVSFDGLIDEVGLWHRVLTAQERTDLYNGGAGLAYETEPPPLDVPTLTSIAPTQGVQGSTVAVTLTGTAFVLGATTVTVSGSGVTVTTVVVSSPTSLTADFVLAPTAAATARTVTVTTDGGTSGAQPFTITALPVEPPEPGDLADSSLVDTALIALLAADAQLATMLPGGVHFGLAPQGVTAFALVAIDETEDDSVFAEVPSARRAIEKITYAVQAVLPTSAMAPVTQAAARIDALLQDQPLSIPGYGWLSTVRVERLRPAGEPDAGDKNIRWQHAGGRYRVQVTPAV